MDFTVGDEPILDRGVSHYHPSEDDIEDHRSQRAVYVGVHLPTDRINQPSRTRRRRHKRPKQGNDKKDQLAGIAEDDIDKATDPSYHVMFLLGEDDEGEEPHNLFCEMDELRLEDGESEWKETARWIKFEEDVEEGGERWSKPHVASLSLFSLFEVRNCITSGVIILNVEASNLESITEIILNKIVAEKKITFDQREKVRDVLQKKHRHLHDLKHKSGNKGSQLPLIRSLADIGKKHSARDVEKENEERQNECANRSGKLEPNSSQPNLLKSNSSMTMEKLKSEIDNGAAGGGSDSLPKYDLHFLKKIPVGAETSNILVGETDFLTQMFVVFIRLKDAILLGELTEVPVPTRFLFVLLGPQGGAAKHHEIGRSMATLMSDDVFHDVAYKARNRDDILAGIDEFLSNCTVLPPAEWDPSIRIEPPKTKPISRKVPSMVNAAQAAAGAGGDGKSAPENGGGAGGGQGGPTQVPQAEEEPHEDVTLQRTNRLFGGLINDVKRRAPHYLSDFKDALHIQCFGSFFFLYFACLTPIITFGGLLVQATGGNLGAIESIIAGMLVGVTYALFSGQPLTILGSTGPVLVFESIVYQMCTGLKWDYLPLRMWIGIWIAIFLFMIVAFDLSALVRYITRFTEESFAVLIALIFIVEALKKNIKIIYKYPVDRYWIMGKDKDRDCSCIYNETVVNKYFSTHQKPPRVYNPPMKNDLLNSSLSAIEIAKNINWSMISSKYYTWDHKEYLTICKKWGGEWIGTGCDYSVPDVFFFSCLLFFGTFVIAYGLKMMRTSRFFPNRVRSIISDFAVFIAIFLMTLLDFLIGLHTPKLDVPDRFEPTLGYEVRGWIVPVLGNNPWWTILVAIGPALLAVILIFMDQQITAVIVNRKENKLKKGAGYHLDLLIVAILILINSILGIPWFVAATVLSINHVMSLKKESENVAPGERPTFLGCREQRVTGVLIFLTIGLSVFLTPLLKKIPMPVLYGVFLFMGVASLKGVQLMQRMSLFFIPGKYQPDYIYLRYVPLRRVHLFTFIQIGLLALLWVIKSIKSLSICFPLMVLALCFVRKGLDYVFSRNELKWLDDIMPEHKKRQQDDKRRESKADDEIELQEPAVEMNSTNKIIKSNDSGINISEEMGKTGIWKNLTGSGKSGKTGKSKNRTKRKRVNKDVESGNTCDEDTPSKKAEGPGSNYRQPLLAGNAAVATGDLAEEGTETNADLMTSPSIVVDPPSGRGSPTGV